MARGKKYLLCASGKITHTSVSSYHTIVLALERVRKEAFAVIVVKIISVQISFKG